MKLNKHTKPSSFMHGMTVKMTRIALCESLFYIFTYHVFLFMWIIILCIHISCVFVLQGPVIMN